MTLEEAPNRAMKFTVFALGLAMVGLFVILISTVAKKTGGLENCEKSLALQDRLGGIVKNIAIEGKNYLLLIEKPGNRSLELVKIDSCHGIVLSRLALPMESAQEAIPNISPMP